MAKYIFLLLLALQSFQLKAEYTIETVPNPKDTDGGWVSNPDNLLSNEDVYAINQLITDIENKTTAQIAVVVLKSIGDQVPKDFANRLFNHWGIGQKDKNNGLLLLVVMEPKRWEFETGYGLEGPLPDVTLFRIGEQVIVPHFKEGDFGQGIHAALSKVGEILIDPSVAQEIYSEENNESTKSQPSKSLYEALAFLFLIVAYIVRKRIVNKFQTDGKKEDTPMDRIVFYSIIYSVPLILVINRKIPDAIFDSSSHSSFLLLFYIQYFTLSLISRVYNNKLIKDNDPYAEFIKFKNSHAYIGIYAFAFPLIFLPYLFWYYYRKNYLRNTPRFSSSGKPMTKLDEKADDQYLNKGQLMEETLKSVDYDVWVTEDNTEQKIHKYESTFSKYLNCPGCKYITGYLKSDRTLKAATYSSSGKGEKVYACKNCSHTYKQTYIIPQKERSSSSSGSSSSSSSSSFGGGSSGGGGAGGSW